MNHLKIYENFLTTSLLSATIDALLIYLKNNGIKVNSISGGKNYQKFEYIKIDIKRGYKTLARNIINKKINKYFIIDDDLLYLEPLNSSFQEWFIDLVPYHISSIKEYMNIDMKKKYEDLLDGEELGLL